MTEFLMVYFFFISVAEFCVSIVNSVTQEEDEEAEGNQLVIAQKDRDSITPQSSAVIKNKIRSAAKFALMLKALRDNSEDILKIKKQMPDNKIPPGLLQKGQAEIRKGLEFTFFFTCVPLD